MRERKGRVRMAERSESEMARTIRDGCARTVWHASCSGAAGGGNAVNLELVV